ncbi:penicillin acylase family protein [Humibacter albus]|uniref:penicillin acylase family protein n=1 Tax=Humibacter albus TaxID=427754 RepID=UPI0003B52B56|nr:penicillin acylase family protein [Humibacter albus]
MGTDASRLSRRHPFWRFVGILLAVVVTLALIAGVLAFWTVTRSFPQTSGSIDIPGLHSKVEVQRDDAGIPQITASDAHDLFLAEGYVHAQDRFWEMDFRRHVTAGRLSELFGASQLGTDEFIRTLGWRRVAEQEVKQMDATSLSYYRAYADGVNAYLKTHKGADISLEYAVLGLQTSGYTPAKWTPVDSVSWLKAMAWDLRSNLEEELDRAVLGTTLTPDEVAQLHPTYPYADHPTITDAGGGDTQRTSSEASGGSASAKSTTASQSPSTGSTSADSASTGSGSTDSASIAGTTTAAKEATADLKQLASRVETAAAAVPALLGMNSEDIGSNSWVVSGKHTATGKPLLSNDPHLGPAAPSIWYQVGLHCAKVTASCPFDVAGYSFSGLPGVVIGHNQSIAWGFTNLGPDVTDLYLEKLSGAGYEYDGKVVPFTVRKETIKVAGSKPVTITVRSTVHGPIVTGGQYDTITAHHKKASGGFPAGKYALSLQWTALTPGHTAEAIFTIDRATDWAQFRDAARQFDVPAQNLIYADTAGNIGYQAPGRIPVRKQGDGTSIEPGWSSAYGWSGYVSFDQLPSLYNPSSGFIVTANNAAVGPKYAVNLTQDWDAGYRADRITADLKKLIHHGTKITSADMSRIDADTYDENAATLVPILTKLSVDSGTSKAIALLKDWDYRDEADSAAAAYFNIFWRNLLHDAFARKLPSSAAPTGGARWFQVVADLLAQKDASWWLDTKLGVDDRDQMFAYAATQAYHEAVKLMGPETSDWKWGDIHTLEVTNQSFGVSGIAPIEALFNRGPYKLGGSSSVVDAVGWDASVGYAVNWVPSMRQVVDLADFDRSSWINLTGDSGHAFNPHYMDQLPLWQQNRTRPWPFTPKAVTKATRDTLTLRPQ